MCSVLIIRIKAIDQRFGKMNDIVYGGRLRSGTIRFINGIESPYEVNYTSPTRRSVRVKSLGSRPNGYMFPKPYFAMYRDLVPPTGRGSVTYEGLYQNSWHGGAEVPGDLMFTNHFSVPYDVVTRAEMQALAALKEQRIDIGAMVAESRETIGMIATVAGNIYGAYQDVRHGDLRGGLRRLGVGNPTKFRRRIDAVVDPARNAAGAWLYVNWGVIPLVNDIDDAIKNVMSNEPWQARIVGKGFASERLPPKRVEIGGAGASDYVWAELHPFASATCSLAAYPDTTFFHDLGEVGLNNPLASAWEAVFLSALADYFLPVGDWLNTLDAGHGMRFLSGSSTSRLSVKAQFFGGKPGGRLGSPLVDLDTEYKGRFQEISIQRTTYTSFPTTNPFFVKDPFSGAAGLKRALNTVALLTGFLRGGYRPPQLG